VLVPGLNRRPRLGRAGSRPRSRLLLPDGPGARRHGLPRAQRAHVVGRGAARNARSRAASWRRACGTSGRGVNQGASPDRWLFDATDASVAIGEVRRQIDAKVNWVAGYDALPPDVYRAMVAAARRTGVRISGQPGASSMNDLAAAGVASIETLAYPLKARNGPAADAWPDGAARDLACAADTFRARPGHAGAVDGRRHGRRVPGRGRRRPGSRTTARGEACRTQGRARQDARIRGGESEARLGQPGGIPEAFRGRPRPGGSGYRFRIGRLSRAGRGPPPRALRARSRGLPPIEAIRAATSTAADLVGAKPASVRFTPGADADFIVVTAIPSRRSKTSPTSRTSSAPARCSIRRC